MTAGPMADVQELIEQIADTLGTGVSLDDLSGQLVAYSTQHGRADDARVQALVERRAPTAVRAWEEAHGASTAVRPLMIPANPRLGMSARLCIPLVSRGVRTGLLFAISDEVPVSDAVIAERVGLVKAPVELLAGKLYEAASPYLDARRQRERTFLEACRGVTSAIAEVEQLAGVRSSAKLVLTVSLLLGDQAGQLHEARFEQQRLATTQAVDSAPAVAASSISDREVVVLARNDRSLARTADRMHERLVDAAAPGANEFASGAGIATGVAEVGSIAQLPLAYRRAAAAAEASSIERSLWPVSWWSEIGVYQLISQLERLPESELLTRLETVDVAGSLCETLEAIYDHAGPAQDVAAALHLHRTSLYYRIKKVRDLLGGDPLAGQLRLELHWALKSRRWRDRQAHHQS